MIFFIFQARRNKTRKATVISILQQRRKKKMMSSEYKLWKRMQGQTKDYKGNVFHAMISWHWEVNKNPSQGLYKHPSTW